MGKEEPNGVGVGVEMLYQRRMHASGWWSRERSIVDARCRGAMRKIKTFYFTKTSVNTHCSVGERLCGWIYGTCETPSVTNSGHEGNCKKEVRSRLHVSSGQITRRVQDQSHRDIWEEASSLSILRERKLTHPWQISVKTGTTHRCTDPIPRQQSIPKF